MKRVGFFLAISILLIHLPAGGQGTISTRDHQELEFQSALLKTQIVEKITAVLTPLVPEVRFVPHVTIHLKSEKVKPQGEAIDDSKDLVDLGKLGTVAKSINTDLLSQDLKRNISHITVMMIFYSHIDDETHATVKDILKKTIKHVPIWRLKIETVVPPAEKKDFKNWMNENKWLVFVSLIFLAILAVGISAFAYLIRTLFYMQKNLTSLTTEVRTSNLAHSQPDSAYSPPMLMPAPYQRENLPVVMDVSEASARDPFQERTLIEGMFASGQFDQLMEYCRRNFPIELIFKLPHPLLIKAFNSLPLKCRIDVFLTLDSNERVILEPAFGKRGTRVRQFMDFELQRYQRDGLLRSQIEANATINQTVFIEMVRSYVRSNKEFSRHAKELLENWIYERSDGAAGRKHAS